MNVTRYALRAAGAAFGVAAVIAAVRGARRGNQEWRDEGRPEQRDTTGVLVVAQPREEVYDLLRDLPRLAEALGPTVSIETLSESEFVWVQTGPGHPPIATTVRITGDVPELLLSWRTEDPPLPHEGTLRFSVTPDGVYTQLDVHLRYRWSMARAREAGIPDDAVQTMLYRHLTVLGESPALSGTP
ncbi:hypothetical protein [Rugosimonospora acidiphila]|uniref:hypothetical protein n=1 Tax=Rugosimonospora acidiphila TaxID=556531 RepID=UPI0031F0D097